MTTQLSTLEIVGYLLGSGFLGSLITMCLTRFLDNLNEQKARKLWVFRTLMANFRNRFSYDFVSAINLVEVEFDEDKNVRVAWKDYRTTLNLKNRNPTEQEAKIGIEEIDHALANLVQVIGASLGYKRDKLDILNNSYIPSLWDTDNAHVRKKEQLLMEILESKRALSFKLESNNPSPHQANSQPSATFPQGESD